jgi:hypothetical protein
MNSKNDRSEETLKNIKKMGHDFKAIMKEEAKKSGDFLQNLDEELYGKAILLFLDKYLLKGK